MKKALFTIISLFMAFIIQAQQHHPVIAKSGMVAATEPLSAQAGLSILQQGGNAIDAAIATAFAMAVTYPSAGNIGGGGFLLYHSSDGFVTSIDFRIKAPLAADSSHFYYIRNDTLRLKPSPVSGLSLLDSPLSIGVPGTVAGMALAHKKYGSLPWHTLIEPAIRLAEEGFPVSYNLHNEMKNSMDYFMAYPSSAAFFLKDGVALYKPGEIWKQPDMAYTLKKISELGKAGFYQGEIAKSIVKSINSYGGIITLQDFTNYKAVERKPVAGSYRGYEIYSMPLPSSGGIGIIEMLNILEGYDLLAMGHNSAQYLHTLTEAMRISYRDRAMYLGDPEFTDKDIVKKLLSKEYADYARSTISPDSASISSLADIEEPYESTETTHFTVVDGMGNAVSVTYSLNGDFGAYLVPEGTGVVLNNTMTDFNLVPGYTTESGLIGTPPNIVRSGSIPLSSMAPTIIAKNNKPVLAYGSPGGKTIITTNLQIALNFIDFGMNVAEAISAPRIYHGWLPDEVLFQSSGFSQDTQRLFENMGHKVNQPDDMLFGPAMGIYIDNEGLLHGASDPRSVDGIAAGF